MGLLTSASITRHPMHYTPCTVAFWHPISWWIIYRDRTLGAMPGSGIPIPKTSKHSKEMRTAPQFCLSCNDRTARQWGQCSRPFDLEEIEKKPRFVPTSFFTQFYLELVRLCLHYAWFNWTMLCLRCWSYAKTHSICIYSKSFIVRKG